VPIALDQSAQSGTFRYQAPAGDPVPTRAQPARPDHEITVREAPPCPVVTPEPTPSPTPRPQPPPDAIQQHEVWIEDTASAEARLGIASKYGVGGVSTWRLGLEDAGVWDSFKQWRAGER
jgi:hypothetical protein